MTYEQPFIRSHATCQTEQIRHSLQTLKIATCAHSSERVNLLTQPRALLTIVNQLCHTRAAQLAHSSEQAQTSNLPHPKKTFKKYAPTPLAHELFPNFISDVGEVSRPELFEQFCVPIKNSWLLFSWNYLRKSKNWMSFKDLECGVRRPANLHLPLKSYVGHWVINIF